MTRHVYYLGIGLLVAVHLACDAVEPSNPDAASPSDETAQTSGPSADAGSVDSDDAPVWQPDGSLTDNITASLAKSATAAVAKALVSILPVKNLQAIFEQGAPLPACPVLDMEPGATAIQLTMNYGTGCSPASYPLAAFSGTAAGTAFIAVSAFDFTFADLAVNGDALAGTIAGSLIPSGGTVRFVASANLSLSDGTLVRGNMDATVDAGKGAVTLTDTVLHATASGKDSISIELRAVLVAPAATGTFDPVSGEAQITQPGSDTRSTLTFGP